MIPNKTSRGVLLQLTPCVNSLNAIKEFDLEAGDLPIEIVISIVVGHLVVLGGLTLLQTLNCQSPFEVLEKRDDNGVIFVGVIWAWVRIQCDLGALFGTVYLQRIKVIVMTTPVRYFTAPMVYHTVNS